MICYLTKGVLEFFHSGYFFAHLCISPIKLTRVDERISLCEEYKEILIQRSRKIN